MKLFKLGIVCIMIFCSQQLLAETKISQDDTTYFNRLHKSVKRKDAV